MKTLLHPSFLSQLKGWFSPRSPDDVRICDHTVITEQQPSCSHGNDQFGKLHTKLKRWHGFCLSLFTSKPLTFHFLLALFGTRQHLQFCQKLNNEHFYFNYYFLINELLFGLVTFHAGWRILGSGFILLIRCKTLLRYSYCPWMRGECDLSSIHAPFKGLNSIRPCGSLIIPPFQACIRKYQTAEANLRQVWAETLTLQVHNTFTQSFDAENHGKT